MSPPKYVDLLVLAAALAVFVLGGLPMLGYAVAAAAWLAQRGHPGRSPPAASTAELAAGKRQRAMGIVAATTLGRVWLMATAVLLAGCSPSARTASPPRLLVVVLFTVSFAAAGPRPPLRARRRGGRAG